MLFTKANHKNCEVIMEVLDVSETLRVKRLTWESQKSPFPQMFQEEGRDSYVVNWESMQPTI